MKFLVPTNFQDDFIPRLNKKEIYSLYGKLPSDFIGGGRTSFIVPFINKRQVKKHIEQAHRNGLEFTYLLNSVCLGNREYTIKGYRQIRSLLDWLVKIKVNSVTVAMPYIAQIVKKNYPQLKLSASVCANIDSLLKAKYWQDLGVDLITLQSTSLNRNFEALRQIRSGIKCKLALIANDSCLYRCPVSCYHYTVSSHASQSNDYSGKPCIDYCSLNCKIFRLQDPVNIVRAVWIRPEDAHYYENIGIDYLKISGRHKDSNFILNAVNAYVSRRYKGNLADIFPFYQTRFNLQGVKKNLKMFGDEPLKVYIDNAALDGFLGFFVQGNCKQGLCEECGYCRTVAEKAVNIDKEYRSKALSRYKDILNNIVLRGGNNV